MLCVPCDLLILFVSLWVLAREIHAHCVAKVVLNQMLLPPECWNFDHCVCRRLQVVVYLWRSENNV